MEVIKFDWISRSRSEDLNWEEKKEDLKNNLRIEFNFKRQNWICDWRNNPQNFPPNSGGSPLIS